MFSVPNDFGVSRIGITVTRKFGGAVHRNRIRRQIRAIIQNLTPENPGRGRDLVIHVRPEQPKVEFAILKEELYALVKRALGADSASRLSPRRQPSS